MLGSGQGEEDGVWPHPPLQLIAEPGGWGGGFPCSPGLFPSLCSHRSSVVAEPLCRTCDSLWEDLSAESADGRKGGGANECGALYTGLVWFMKGLISVLKTGSIWVSLRSYFHSVHGESICLLMSF
jgi:hypothetical protein